MRVSEVLAKGAEKLNKKVQEKIDPHLFLSCNYEPTIAHAISEDAFYHLAIQDLYKFAIDSSCIIKGFEKYIPSSQLKKFYPLRDILDQISMLRSVLDHNQSEKNGRYEKTQLEEYQNWIYSVLSKSAPEAIGDYVLLNRRLSDIAGKLLTNLDQFVDCVAGSQDKGIMIEKWKDNTLYWYCNNTKREIYTGQLMEAYIAKAKAHGRDFPNLYKTKNLYRLVNRWIEDALYYPIDRKSAEISAEVEQYENMLSGHNTMYQAMLGKMTPEKADEVQQRFQKKLTEDRKTLFKLAQERQDLDRKTGGKCTEYFFKGLHDQLLHTIAQLDANGQTYTFLPQDLLQEDIEVFFGDVPSPEGHF